MSRAFKFLINTREKFYSSGVLKTFRLNHPVISIGNLTLGGTGKTPLVITLAQRLRNDGFRPVVLSRGYKRKSSGILVVSRGDGPLLSWEDSGDEPYLIASRAPGTAVIVGSDRYEAGRKAEQEGLGNIFILDDGFQHRRLFRNVDIVTIDPAEWASGEKLLPAGRWREPKSAIERAHAALVGKSVGKSPQIVPSLSIPTFEVETVVDGIYEGVVAVPAASLAGRNIVAFAGIAKPERFFAALEAWGISPIRKVRFRDHHAYRADEISQLGGDIQITTEKDAVRLQSIPGARFLHLRISANIPKFDQLMDLIRSRLS